MLSTWGGNNDIDTISQDELDCVGFDTCAEYCEEYCWDHGYGYCDNCAYHKEYLKEHSAKTESESEEFDNLEEMLEKLWNEVEE